MAQRIYRPEELYFSVALGSSDGDLPASVTFTTIECWETNHCCSDDIGSHNMPKDILTRCGVNPFELMESIFEINEGNSVEDVRNNLLANGFRETSDFKAFINNYDVDDWLNEHFN